MLDRQSNDACMWGAFLYALSLPVKPVPRTAIRRGSSTVGARGDNREQARRRGAS